MKALQKYSLMMVTLLLFSGLWTSCQKESANEMDQMVQMELQKGEALSTELKALPNVNGPAPVEFAAPDNPNPLFSCFRAYILVDPECDGSYVASSSQTLTDFWACQDAVQQMYSDALFNSICAQIPAPYCQKVSCNIGSQ